MTLHQLKVFVTVAKLKSFTQAGEKLHIRQPSISGIVFALARELGLKRARLFLGGTSLAAASFLPVAMQAFKKDHPHIDFILKIDGTNALEKKLLDGDLDIAILGQDPRSNLLTKAGNEDYRYSLSRARLHGTSCFFFDR